MNDFENYQEINHVSRLDFFSKVMGYLALGLGLSAIGALAGNYMMPLLGQAYMFAMLFFMAAFCDRKKSGKPLHSSSQGHVCCLFPGQRSDAVGDLKRLYDSFRSDGVCHNGCCIRFALSNRKDDQGRSDQDGTFLHDGSCLLHHSDHCEYAVLQSFGPGYCLMLYRDALIYGHYGL